MQTKFINDSKKRKYYYPWWSVDTKYKNTLLSWVRIMSNSFDYDHLVIGMSGRLPGDDWPNISSLDFK